MQNLWNMHSQSLKATVSTEEEEEEGFHKL